MSKGGTYNIKNANTARIMDLVYAGEITSSEAWLLFRLNHYLGADQRRAGWKALPASKGHLAELCNTSQSSIKRMVKALRDRKLLKVWRVKTDQHNACNCYELSLGLAGNAAALKLSQDGKRAQVKMTSGPDSEEKSRGQNDHLVGSNWPLGRVNMTSKNKRPLKLLNACAENEAESQELDAALRRLTEARKGA